MANEYVKNAEFKTEIGADGFIYADEYEFKSSSIANNFREISDYVDYIFGNRESKITEHKSIVDIIRADAKELDLTIDKLTPANIVNIYNNLLARIAEENRNKQTENEQIEQSQIGIKPVRDFGDGLVMYRLLPDTEYYNEHGEHRNLVYESDQMGICIGQEQQSYSQKIFDLEQNQYYTLRSHNKNGQLIPHCTIEVNGDVVSQVKGKSNGMVNGNYIQPVREFLKKHLNVAFPGEENTDNKGQLYDYSNIGFVKNLHYKTVDLFNLPPNTELGKISYDLLSVKGIDLKNIKSIGTLIWANVGNKEITQKDIDVIQKTCSIKEFVFRQAKLRGKYDFSNTNLKEINLRATDLTNAEIIFPKSIEKIDLSDAKLHGKFDLSNTNLTEINLRATDLTNTEITLPKSIKKIDLSKAKIHGKFGFSNTNLTEIDLSKTDLTDAEIIFPKSIERICLSNAKLHGKYDFSNTNLKTIYLSTTDLTNAEIIFPKSIEKINLYDAKLHGKLDLSNTNLKEIDLEDADLTDAEIILPKSIERIGLSKAKLHGKYDFSNTNLKTIYLSTTDLTNAEIIFPKSIEKINLYRAKLHGKYDFSNTNLKKIYLGTTDLTNAEIIWPKSTEKIDLSNAKLHGKYDFSNTNLKEINLYWTDLTDAEIIVGRNTKIIGPNEKYKNKIVVLQSESKVDVFNKGITNLKNKINEAIQKLKAKISASDREND